MNVPSLTARTDTPSCYGKDWDKNVPECAGGPDPNYTHPQTQQHIREQCNFFQSCGVRVQAARSAQVIPPQNLVRPPIVPPPPAPAPGQTFRDYVQATSAAHLEATRQQALAGARPPIVPSQPTWQQQQQHPTMYQGHAQYPAPMYQLNYQMPGYLTVSEERLPGESLWVVVALEIVRSLIKAFGHSLAHAVDVRRIREK